MQADHHYQLIGGSCIFRLEKTVRQTMSTIANTNKRSYELKCLLFHLLKANIWP